MDNKTAQRWINEYFERLQGVKRYIDDTQKSAHETGYVQTLLGRRRYYTDLTNHNHSVRTAAERAAVNMPIQGTAADIMKLAMIKTHAWLASGAAPKCTLLLQVHDELLFEIEDDAVDATLPGIIDCMENAYPMDVPIRVDAKAGPNWADMKSIVGRY